MRRQIGGAVLLLLLFVASCGGEARTPPGSRSTDSQPSPTTEPVPPPRLPPSQNWSPTTGELTPDVKRAATDALLALATYDVGAGTAEAAVGRLAGIGASPALAAQSAGLLRPDAESAVDIVYPQLGGLTQDTASVMVVADIRTRVPGQPETISRQVVELGVRRTGDSWTADRMSPPATPANTPGPPPPPEVALLLGNTNVELSDSNRRDLIEGRVDPRIVELLLRLAAQRRISVTTFASGHPEKVFGTDRTSNHTVGRAVDVWAVDGVPVADQRGPGSALELLVRQLVTEGVTELGSPFDIDGRGGSSFTDMVHHDHLHLAYRR